MVLTRSADKRLDHTREEDLVLRSRKVSSPGSNASPLSQVRKRTSKPHDNASSPRPKRIRLGLDGTVDSEAREIMVNVPPKTSSWESTSSTHGIDDKLHGSDDSQISNNGLAPAEDEDQTTPKGKATTEPVTPDPNIETFNTPATSRHRRFDSEDLDEDTIVVNTGIDSSGPQEYQTAEEDLADSDDDAPEVETTKLAPRLPQRKSPRTPKTKKQTSTVEVVNTTKDDDITEPLSNQSPIEHTTVPIQPKLLAAESVITSSKQDQTSQPDITTSTLRKSPGSHSPSMLGTSDSQSLADVQPQSIQPTIPNPPKTQPLLKQSQTSAPILAPPEKKDLIPFPESARWSFAAATKTARSNIGPTGSSTFRAESHRTPHAARSRVLPYLFGESDQAVAPNQDPSPGRDVVRLPAKTTSSLTGFRRNKSHQKVARSAGGFNLESSWAKKRSTFVAS